MIDSRIVRLFPMPVLGATLLAAATLPLSAQKEFEAEEPADAVRIRGNALNVPDFEPPAEEIDWKATGEYHIRKTSPRPLASGRRILIHLGDAPRREPPAAKPPPPELSKEELEAMLAEYQAEKFISLSATVVDGKATLLRWRHEGARYKAWSSVDFNYLRGITRFEINSQPYSAYMATGNVTSEHRDGWGWLGVPEGPPPFAEGVVEYEIIGEGAVNDEAFEGILALHKLYASKRSELHDAREKREAENEKRKAWLEENPPEEREPELYFWQGKDGGLLIEDDPAAAPSVRRPSNEKLKALSEAYRRGMRERGQREN